MAAQALDGKRVRGSVEGGGAGDDSLRFGSLERNRRIGVVQPERKSVPVNRAPDAGDDAEDQVVEEVDGSVERITGLFEINDQGSGIPSGIADGAGPNA